MLATFATLPFGWAEGVDGCAGGLPRLRTGLEIASQTSWPVLLVAALAPLALAFAGERARGAVARLVWLALAALAAAADVGLVLMIESLGTEREHRMLAGAGVALAAQALLALELAASTAAAIAGLVRARRRQRTAASRTADEDGNAAPAAARAAAALDARTASPLALAAVPLLAIALSLVDRGRVPPVAALWQRRELPHSGTFQAATGDEDALLLAGTVDSLRSGVTRLEMVTGKVTWSFDDARQVLLGDTPRDPVWVIVDDTGGLGGTELVELDAATGQLVRTIPVHGALARWHRRGSVLLALEATTARRIDPGTGAEMWSSGTAAMDPYHPIVRARAVAMPCGDGLRALCSLSLEDGKQLGRIEDVVQAAAPRAEGSLYTLASTSVSAWARDDAPAWTSALPAGYLGKRVVASERWVLVLAETSARPHPGYLLRALRAADGQVAWERQSAAESYLGYLAADGDLAAYYTSQDATLWVRDLARGGEVPVHRFTGRFVVSPDATGTSPPIPSGDPFLFGSYLVVPDFDAWCAARVRPVIESNAPR